MKRISHRVAIVAATLAATLLSGAVPSLAGPQSPHVHTAQAALTHHYAAMRHRHRHPTGAFAAPVWPSDGAQVPGSWHINGNGLPYQVPYPCAYPIGADSGGAEQFQMFGCPLP